jgi:hypothetical protein
MLVLTSQYHNTICVLEQGEVHGRPTQSIPDPVPVGVNASLTDRVQGHRAEQPHVEHML